MSTDVFARFAKLSTPLISDAALRIGHPLHLAPSGLQPVHEKARMVAGRVAAAKHRGSVDVFLEVISKARKGDVLVIDNDGRKDEGCIGDLTALEAWTAGVTGIIVWGCHRDTAELKNIPIAVFTYGSYPAGPVRLDPGTDEPGFAGVPLKSEQFVFADEDGAIFIDAARVEEVLSKAESIADVERRQAAAIRDGHSLRAQLRFDDYLAKRQRDPSYTLRRHLAEVGGAVEV
jgi:4-hydroxy-4-methyl-2-oxoglutarate aldolase